MNKHIKTIVFFLARLTGYALIMVLLNMIYQHDAITITSTGKFGENSGTEVLQEIFLFVSGLIFLLISRYNRIFRALALLVSVFFFMAFIREFNNQIAWWFYLEIPFILLFTGLLFIYRKELTDSLYALLTSRSISWLVIGFLVTFVFSRLFGRTSFWQQLLESDYNRWAKNAAEEGIELLGYTLMLIGSIEMLVETIRGKRETGERKMSNPEEQNLC